MKEKAEKKEIYEEIRSYADELEAQGISGPALGQKLVDYHSTAAQKVRSKQNESTIDDTADDTISKRYFWE